MYEGENLHIACKKNETFFCDYVLMIMDIFIYSRK